MFFPWCFELLVLRRCSCLAQQQMAEHEGTTRFETLIIQSNHHTFLVPWWFPIYFRTAYFSTRLFFLLISTQLLNIPHFRSTILIPWLLCSVRPSLVVASWNSSMGMWGFGGSSRQKKPKVHMNGRLRRRDWDWDWGWAQHKRPVGRFVRRCTCILLNVESWCEAIVWWLPMFC